MSEHTLPLVERSGTSFCNRVFLYESEEPLRSTTGTCPSRSLGMGGNMECIDRVNGGSDTVTALQKDVKQSNMKKWGMRLSVDAL